MAFLESTKRPTQHSTPPNAMESSQTLLSKNSNHVRVRTTIANHFYIHIHSHSLKIGYLIFTDRRTYILEQL